MCALMRIKCAFIHNYFHELIAHSTYFKQIKKFEDFFFILPLTPYNDYSFIIFPSNYNDYFL